MSDMTLREHYRAVMHFEPGVRTLLWEFGYWTTTLEAWYLQGLPRSPNSLPAGLAAGDSVFAEALPYPTDQPGVVRYRDFDVHKQLGFDEGTARVPLNWRLSPSFQEVVLEEDETTRVMYNHDGVKLQARKDKGSPPLYLEWPIRDRASWEKLKEERFGADIMSRFPERWEAVSASYGERDFPLGLVTDGLFSSPRELMGFEGLLMMYYDDPQLMHDINNHLTTTWLAMYEEVVSKVEIDFVYIWEDMSYKNGPMLSPKMFDEFFVPYYQRLTGFLRAHGVDVIFVDTDGDFRQLIPGFLQGGVSGIYPVEVQAEIDVIDPSVAPNKELCRSILLREAP
jgi:uroporphyrinogen decarboxylase